MKDVARIATSISPAPMKVRIDDRAGVPPTGFLIVRLAKKYSVRAGETLLDVATANDDLSSLARYLRDRDLTLSTRSIITVAPARILEWELLAARSEMLAPLRSLLQYWRVDARGVIGKSMRATLDELVAAFNRLPGVSVAYVELGASPAGIDPSDDGEYPKQSYLAAPVDPAKPNSSGGINAKHLWDMGYDGSGIGFVDVEHGWFLEHRDLVAQGAKTIPGDGDDPSFLAHGTSVLGIVAAVDNAMGVVGIAPNVASVTVSSVVRPALAGMFIADAIVNAINVTAAGDVILVETQQNNNGSHYPVEISDDVFDAIRLASALGRVVVEAAGNGEYHKAAGGKPSSTDGIDLDSYLSGGLSVLKRGIHESGAIVVGASVAGPSYTPRGDSNYGSRVDCFAPGVGITTCDYDNSAVGNAQSTYTDDFAQTSAASAIIAGAAVLVQSAWKKRTGSVLSPLALRALLSDPTINWPQGASARAIGVMPNLGEIINARLPDIYLRDDIADDGNVPSSGALSASPDIIVRAAAVVNPNGSFGQGSGTEQNVALSDSVLAGEEHFVYARLRNRGAIDALGVTVTIYWSPTATLVTPDQWHLIGSTPAFNVPAGDILVVSRAVHWPAAEQPGLGHYCFVAVASHASDLAPPLPGGPIAWDDFLGLVRNNNNVTWRNFDVVSLPTDAAKSLTLAFTLAGAPDDLREFTIEVSARSLQAKKIKLEVAPSVAEQLGRTPARLPRSADGELVVLDLTPQAGLRKRRIVLEKGARHECSIVIDPPFGPLTGRESIVVRQWYEGIEVGRITWALTAQEER